ncbi:MAG: hypothetical protein K9L59_10830 [Desulfobacterales bacterium]|nr:hypothetical protein [Desulfobacterales bacterium]
MTGKFVGIIAVFAFVLLPAEPASPGFLEDLKKGWQDLKASFQKAPEEAKEDGKDTWEEVKEDAEKAARKSREAAKEAAKDARTGWQEVKDAVKSP